MDQQHHRVIILFLALLLQPGVASGLVSVIQEIQQAVMVDLVEVVVLGVLQQLLAELEIHHQCHHHKEILAAEMVDLQLALMVLVVVGALVV
jgi:hypothetical protein